MERAVPDVGVLKWKVVDDESRTRLDRFIKRRAPGIPQGLIQRLIRQKRIKIGNAFATRSGHLVHSGEVVEFPGEVSLEIAPRKPKPTADALSPRQVEYIRSHIIYQDAKCIALNKPPGLPIQGGSGIGKFHLETFLPGIGPGRYWLVHRLDKEVSGAMVVARDVGAAATFAKYFREHRIEKVYWALVVGKVSSGGGVINMDVDGKSASTEYQVVQRLGGFGAWLALRPKNGRKHQLRIHCAEGLKCPIVGDTRYGGLNHRLQEGPMFAEQTSRGILDLIDHQACLHLHARSLLFPKVRYVRFPSQGKKDLNLVRVVAPLSNGMKSSWEKLGLVGSDGDQITWSQRFSH